VAMYISFFLVLGLHLNLARGRFPSLVFRAGSTRGGDCNPYHVDLLDSLETTRTCRSESQIARD
jgi:hypothetical protein